MALVWGLTILGVNTGAVLAGVGIVGLIIGFGAQSLIEDIITGTFIIFENQYSVGDIIVLDDVRGTVRSIGVRTTVIEDDGGNLKVVNNSDIRNFQNRSRNTSLAIIVCAVSYDTDLRKLEQLMLDKLPFLPRREGTDVYFRNNALRKLYERLILCYSKEKSSQLFHVKQFGSGGSFVC